MVRMIETVDEFDAVLKESGGKLVVVDFTASWCGPCKMMAPKYEKMSEDPANKNVVFLKVDVDEAADVAGKCEVTSMPTFKFYKNGKMIAEFTGANEDKLRRTIESHR